MSFAPGDLLFVVGAHAPAGKTKVIAALVAELRTLGLSPVALKPVETSCPVEGDHDIGSRDGAALAALNDPKVPRPVIVPYRLRGEGPAREAARSVGLDLRLADLTATLAEAARYGDVLVIEVVGLALDAIAEDGNPLDWAERVGGKLVVVQDRGSMAVVSTNAVLDAAKAKGLRVFTRMTV